MLNCFTFQKDSHAIPITVILQNDFAKWRDAQSKSVQEWLKTTQFRNENFNKDNVRIIPNETGKITQVICCVADANNFWNVGQLPWILPEGVYQFAKDSDKNIDTYATAWGLGAYQFTRYKKQDRKPATLYLPANKKDDVLNAVESIYMVRDLINTPTDDLGPTEFAQVAKKLAEEYGASFKQIVGDELLKQNYAAIYTVGRASDDAPRLLDLRFGKKSHPKVTLVGKGVCFDTGGLDLKPSSYMLLMKKDMAGGAHALGLARMIMQAKLPIYLRVLIPVVENVISGNAYRPGDIIKSRKGITIEIGNTDAEGRVILADAITEAVNDKPELLIDITTLTGAARVALGTELPALFCNQDAVADDLIKQGQKITDPVWRMPLFAPYREFLNSTIADINNNSFEPYGGAITAALFLKEFVPDNIPWIHLDMMAWNLRPRPGRPQGGEAMALRALYAYLNAKYSR